MPSSFRMSSSSQPRCWRRLLLMFFLLALLLSSWRDDGDSRLRCCCCCRGQETEEEEEVVVVPDNDNDNDNDDDKNIGTFVWLTDAHYDAYYGTPYAEVHIPGSPCNLTASEDGGGDGVSSSSVLPGPPPFSAYGCGSNLRLLEAAFGAAAAAAGSGETTNTNTTRTAPDFVLFTGDSTRHRADEVPNNNGTAPVAGATALAAIDAVQDLFARYFPNVPVVQLPALDLGNNDLSGGDYVLNVTSHEPCLATTTTTTTDKSDGNTSLPRATNEWLELLSVRQSRAFATDLERATFACGGYLNRRISDGDGDENNGGGLHVLVLNTIVLAAKHTPVPTGLDAADPFGQFRWLEHELGDIRANGGKAYVTGHVPPMLHSLWSSLGVAEYDHSLRLLRDVLAPYADVVAGMFFGHVHSNQVRALPRELGFPDDGPPMLVSGSLAPCYETTPFFSLVKYDRGPSKYPVDVVTYRLDLDKNYSSSQDGADVVVVGGGENRSSTYPFEKMFDSLVEYLGLKSLTNGEVRNRLFPGLADIDDGGGDGGAVWRDYFGTWYQGGTAKTSYAYNYCNNASGCRRGEACLVACGFFQEHWARCTNGSTSLDADEACGFADTDGDSESDSTRSPDTPTDASRAPKSGSAWACFSVAAFLLTFVFCV